MVNGGGTRQPAKKRPTPWYVLPHVIAMLVGLVAISWMAVKPPAWTADADRIVLPDGRHLAYYVRGDLNRSNVIFWQHATISCRLEVVGMLPPELLDELDIAVVGIDRPAYGQSDPHATRTFLTYADDVISLADALGVTQRFFIAGVSGGGGYTQAVASRYPERIRGLALMASVGPKDLLTDEEIWRRNPEFADPVTRMLLGSGWLAPLYIRTVRSTLGARLSYLTVRGVVYKLPDMWAKVDKPCVHGGAASWYMENIPESLRQRTGTSFWEDIAFYITPWGFNISALPKELAETTHIWQGHEDLQVSWLNAEKMHQAMPGSHLHLLPGEGHVSFWGCNPKILRQIIVDLLRTGRPAVSPI